jgi:hypothetical protein
MSSAVTLLLGGVVEAWNGRGAVDAGPSSSQSFLSFASTSARAEARALGNAAGS